MESSRFDRQNFPLFLRLIAHNAAERSTGSTYLMTSDVAWQFPGCAPKDNIRLWWDKSELIAYGWFQPPDNLKFDARIRDIEYEQIFSEALAWAEKQRLKHPPSFPFYLNLDSMAEWADAVQNLSKASASSERYLLVSALESDNHRIEFLHSNGFMPTRHFEPVLTRELSEVEIADSPPGFEVREVKEDELEQRVNLHSAAWAPASGFNMDRYQKVRRINEVFDPDLDIVAVSKQGEFVSYTIAWADPISLIGSFEPFGTHPQYRGTGASQAVLFEGFSRLAEKGMKSARIYTAGFNHQAQSLYRSCGFRDVDTSRTMMKKIQV